MYSENVAITESSQQHGISWGGDLALEGDTEGRQEKVIEALLRV